MSTDVIYNDIKLKNVVTREWTQETVYDESGTDVIGHRFKLRFEGILHVQNVPDAPAWIARSQGAAGDKVATLVKVVATALGQSRKQFLVKINGDEVLRCMPSIAAFSFDVNRDIDNGPKPIDVQIRYIVSNQVLGISFGIECTKVLCEPYGGLPQLVLNNRWSITEQMDENFFTTRIIRGRIRFSTSSVAAHAFRGWVVPGLEQGFRRERIEFQELENGLEATYEVTDKQVHTAAPFPATKITGTHTESTALGVTFFSQIAIRLEGPPHIDKRLLIERAVQIMESRFDILSRRLQEDYKIESAAIIDHIGEKNVIELQVRVMGVPGRQEGSPALYLANLRENEIGKPLELDPVGGVEYDLSTSQAPSVYGYTAGQIRPRTPTQLFLMACFQQSPCQEEHMIMKPPGYWPGYGQDEGGSRDNYPSGLQGTTVSQLTPSPGDGYDDSHKEAIYTLCRAESNYVFKSCRTQMPIARKAGGASATLDTSIIFDLALPQCYREIRVESERVGRWPEIPEPVDKYTDGDGSLRGKLVDHWDRALPPTLAADGSQSIFKIEAYYRYALNRPPTKDESTRVGVLPFTSRTQDDNALTRSEIYNDRLQP